MTGDLPRRAIWLNSDGRTLSVIDQTRLPHDLVISRLDSLDGAADAIRTMVVRGAPLIGATAAYGVCFALAADASDARLDVALAQLAATRPTAINLEHALARLDAALRPVPPAERVDAAYAAAAAICDEDEAINAAIGRHGLELLKSLPREEGRPIQVMTHCNAGWLATVEWGTALAPVYMAHDAGLPVHVWVSETRPRNQGAALTTWELAAAGVPHTLIADNAAGHLLQRGAVDLVITGTDRTLRSGDVCNKVGTYLKALAAWDCDVPFYVAVPSPSIDWQLDDAASIPIEERSADELTQLAGLTLVPDGTPAANYAFDVTPARLVSGLITERGICDASPQGLQRLFPEHFEGRGDA
jgi:methylthioribose-1-phosphate isomerase